MSSLLIFCRDCAKQVASSQTKNGLCLDCQVRRAVADLRDEHARLWRKRERYRTQNANVEQIGRQISRVEDRMVSASKSSFPTSARPSTTCGASWSPRAVSATRSRSDEPHPSGLAPRAGPTSP